MQRVNFYAGEEKHVRLVVHATNGEAFTIREASWKLCWAGETEECGTCLIEDHILDVKIAPARKTTYQLIITYRIADETLVEKIEVVVT